MTTTRVEREEFLHDTSLIGPGLLQYGVKCCDHRHPQFTQECEDMAASGSAVDAELVLKADHVHVADV